MRTLFLVLSFLCFPYQVCVAEVSVAGAQKYSLSGDVVGRFEVGAGQVLDWDVSLAYARFANLGCDFDPLIGACVPPIHYASVQDGQLTFGTSGPPGQSASVELSGPLVHGSRLEGVFVQGGVSGYTLPVVAFLAPEGPLPIFFAIGLLGAILRVGQVGLRHRG